MSLRVYMPLGICIWLDSAKTLRRFVNATGTDSSSERSVIQSDIWLAKKEGKEGSMSFSGNSIGIEKLKIVSDGE